MNPALPNPSFAITVIMAQDPAARDRLRAKIEKAVADGAVQACLRLWDEQAALGDIYRTVRCRLVRGCRPPFATSPRAHSVCFVGRGQGDVLGVWMPLLAVAPQVGQPLLFEYGPQTILCCAPSAHHQVRPCARRPSAVTDPF